MKIPKDPSNLRMTEMKSKYTEEQIIGFLRQVEAGIPVKELCRKHGFSDASFYKWRAKFGGMDVSEARRLKELESENGKPAAGGGPSRYPCTQDGTGHKVVAPRTNARPSVRWSNAVRAQSDAPVPWWGYPGDSYRHPTTPSELNSKLSAQIIDIAHQRRRAGYRMIHDLLRPEHPNINHKRSTGCTVRRDSRYANAARNAPG